MKLYSQDGSLLHADEQQHMARSAHARTSAERSPVMTGRLEEAPGVLIGRHVFAAGRQ